MKILFVCHGNVVRSQIAHAFFERLSAHSSACAGTQVNNNDGQALCERAKEEGEQGLTRGTMDSMATEGIDISRNVRKQLTPAMIDEADKVIVMTAQETWPDCLKDCDKVEIWNVTANVSSLGYDGLCEIRDHIKGLVSGLIQQVG